jgi:hypothetical protein
LFVSVVIFSINSRGKNLLKKSFSCWLSSKVKVAPNLSLKSPDPKWKPTNVTEILAFIGLHVVMSVIQLPSYTLGWKQMWPYTISGIPQVMQRERFCKLGTRGSNRYMGKLVPTPLFQI